MEVGPFRDDTDHDDDFQHFLEGTYPSTFLVKCTLVEEAPVHLFANAVVVHNPVVALDIQVVDVVHSGIRRLSHALILTFVLSASMNLYTLRGAAMVGHHSFDPETCPLMVVVVPLDTDLVVAAVVRDPMVESHLANAPVVVDHASHNVVVEVLHNILLVGRVMGVDHLEECRLRNVALVAEAVVDIVVIDPLVVEELIAIQWRMFHHQLVLSAYSFFLPVQEM
jgi:hypothetical protein